MFSKDYWLSVFYNSVLFLLPLLTGMYIADKDYSVYIFILLFLALVVWRLLMQRWALKLGVIHFMRGMSPGSEVTFTKVTEKEVKEVKNAQVQNAQN